jgi:hypothetical protein
VLEPQILRDIGEFAKNFDIPSLVKIGSFTRVPVRSPCIWSKLLNICQRERLFKEKLWKKEI